MRKPQSPNPTKPFQKHLHCWLPKPPKEKAVELSEILSLEQIQGVFQVLNLLIQTLQLHTSAQFAVLEILQEFPLHRLNQISAYISTVLYVLKIGGHLNLSTHLHAQFHHAEKSLEMKNF